MAALRQAGVKVVRLAGHSTVPRVDGRGFEITTLRRTSRLTAVMLAASPRIGD
jgi:hypothetical protein